MNFIALKISKSPIWHTVVSCLLIFDYFLFVTGNFSITYGILGGWFEVTLIAIAINAAPLGYGALSTSEAKRSFILHLAVIALFSLGLLVVSTHAKDFADARMQANVSSFVKDPVNSEAEASNEERQLMLKVKGQKYSMEREGFIPAFRRMDYLFKTQDGERYRLIMTMSWNGRPIVSLRYVDG